MQLVIIETGRSIAELARELEINEGRIDNWVNEQKQSNPVPRKGLTLVQRARAVEMAGEIHRQWMGNELLGNATAHFA